jgi:GntR family transcriptional regulator, transcriptional repressor for pyruvate dehydrogenase complex
MIGTTKPGDLVTQQILDKIFRGKTRPGDKLPSAESMSKENGVSLVSAREALKNLEAIGLVSILHGKGIFVTDGGPVIEEMLEARKMLECHNVEMAARKITDEDLAGLEYLMGLMNEAIRIGDIRAFSENDHHFHMMIGKVSGNRFLFKLFETTKNLLFYQQTMVNRYPGNPEVAFTHHKRIFEALKQKDAPAARAAMSEHLDEALRVFKKSVEDSLGGD